MQKVSTVVGIDTGTNHIGVSVQLVHYSDATLSSKLLYAKSIDLSKMYRKHVRLYQEDLVHPKRFINLMLMYDFLSDIFKEYSPDKVVCEGAFSKRFVQSYGALSEAVHTIRMAAYDHGRIAVEVFAPKHVKKMFTGNGTSDKDAMLARLNCLILGGTIDTQLDIGEVGEHGIDSVAIGLSPFIICD